MSYLENGSTHRSLFRLMSPMHHDADPNRSQVLAYVMENMGLDALGLDGFGGEDFSR